MEVYRYQLAAFLLPHISPRFPTQQQKSEIWWNENVPFNYLSQHFSVRLAVSRTVSLDSLRLENEIVE